MPSFNKSLPANRELLAVERSLIYDATAQPANRRIAFFTSLCRLGSGKWLCGFQVGTSKHAVDSTIQICRSSDNGLTWKQLDLNLQRVFDGVPGSLSAPAMIETAPGRLLLFATWFDRSDPQRPLFDPVTEGILHSRLLLAISSDEGTTWSQWRVIPTPGLAGCSGTGPIVSWPDGTLVFPFESFKEFDDPRPARHGAWVLVSRDGGETFSPPHLVAQDPDNKVYYWDQRIAPTNYPQEYVALFWTHDRETKRDRNVHLRRASLGSQPVSKDGAIRETTLPGQISAPLQLPDGLLLAFVVDRRSPCTLTLWQSSDEGRTWPEDSRLIIHTHDERAAVVPGGEAIDFAQYWEDMGKWSFGHPALHALDDSHVLCAYYAGTPSAMSIHGVRVRV